MKCATNSELRVTNYELRFQGMCCVPAGSFFSYGLLPDGASRVRVPGAAFTSGDVGFISDNTGVRLAGRAIENARRYMPVDALLVELLAKIVGQRSQVRFLLTGFPQGVTND